MKVGDYVRTDTGQIGKITYFEGDMVRVDCDKFITYKSNHNEIIEISPNIIDLIEVGDYVNGSYIYSIVKENKNTGQPRVLFTEEDGVLGSGDIKSIVTKEQFESMEYKVGE